MENASKALLMAGGVLIGILILSLAVYLFTTFGATSARIQNDLENQRIVEFNAQFTIYEGKEVKIHDIVTVFNLAKENNEFYKDYADYENNYKITINIQRSDILEQQEISKIMENAASIDGGLDQIYEVVSPIEYHDNGRIKSMIFKIKS